MSSRSKYEFWKEASLSQQLAEKDKDYVELAGSDTKTSLKIQRLKVLARHKIINLERFQLILDLLNGDRKARFATSDKVNEITKMGLQMPKGEDIISEF
jgi:hypothetical protein